MNYDRFLSIIQREAGVDRQVAEAAARVTLETLAERLMAGNARKLARHEHDRRRVFDLDLVMAQGGQAEGLVLPGVLL